MPLRPTGEAVLQFYMNKRTITKSEDRLLFFLFVRLKRRRHRPCRMGRIITWQRYRDTAAECRKRARSARSPKRRAEFEAFAWHYEEASEAELKRAPKYLFRCPIAQSVVHGFLVEEAPSDDPNSYTPVSCLACGRMHLVNLTTGKTVGDRD